MILKVKNARLQSGDDLATLWVEDGVFIDTPPPEQLTKDGHESYDAGGRLLLPGFVDGHAHIDKSLWGMDWYENDVPRNLEAIVENERRFRRENSFDSHQQSQRISEQALRQGTTHIRTHIDVDTEIGIAHVEGVLATKEALKDKIDIELVCFPQSGMIVRPGTYDVMDAGMKAGCDLVGGIDPSTFERDPVEHLDQVFKLAEKYGKGVDLHLHEPGELGAFSVELMIERTKALSMQGNVTISHAFCLGEVSQEHQEKLAADLGENSISIATTAPANRTVPPFDLLRKHGVEITAGNDGIRDTWSPYGTGDMLQRAMFMGLKYRWRKDVELQKALYAITQGGANVMQLKDYGLETGCKADFVLLNSRNHAEAIVAGPVDRTVFKRGECVVEDGVLI
ncbi:amidohydrolase family protein [Qingshengfaniella alkalisoli]|uniref:Amidohydrolase family protein n=1 Tax=Qingshengfaniella alkalisoli TaxID=2599296 RepID=A0A5B8IAY6_9RHOB|nr:amidohydrolase family protein [Qingshengfaniella alkalisoli]QDY70506.1 amidohydrolase family protein [Qingshengfaniella alkalisoli]